MQDITSSPATIARGGEFKLDRIWKWMNRIDTCLCIHSGQRPLEISKHIQLKFNAASSLERIWWRWTMLCVPKYAIFSKGMPHQNTLFKCQTKVKVSNNKTVKGHVIESGQFNGLLFLLSQDECEGNANKELIQCRELDE